MPFRENVPLDPSQVEDRRGRGVGPGLAIGGGGIGLIVLMLVAMLLGVDPSAVIGGVPTGQPSSYAADAETTLQECQRGADANVRADCRVVGFVNSVQAFWRDEFARRGGTYQPTRTVQFSQATQTGCGTATSAVGPFYCPDDRSVYLDLGFFDELHRRFGASLGPLAEGYVVAHEYGHHVQGLTGALGGAAARDTGPGSRAVQTELQADCFAGVWARHAEATGYLTPFTEQDLRDALETAAAVGDDRIQQRTQGRINPETWTHGSSQQRQQAFTQGYLTGDVAACARLGVG